MYRERSHTYYIAEKWARLYVSAPEVYREKIFFTDRTHSIERTYSI